MSVSNRCQTHKNSDQWYAKMPNRSAAAVKRESSVRWITFSVRIILCLLPLHLASFASATNEKTDRCQPPPPWPKEPRRQKIVIPEIDKTSDAIRRLPARDADVRVALKIGPELDGKDPEWLLCANGYVKFFEIEFRQPFEEMLSVLVCALFPRCLVTRTEPPAEQYDILLDSSYIGTASVAASPDFHRIAALRLSGRISVSSSEGQHITTVEAQHTARSEEISLWRYLFLGGEAGSAKKMAETALSYVFQELGESINQSDLLGHHLALLAEQHARPASLRLGGASFDDGDGVMPNGALDAGEQGYIKLSIRNEGPGTAYGVIVKASSKQSQLQLSEPLSLGDIALGRSHETSLRIAANLDLPQETIKLRIDAEEKRGYGATPVLLEIPARRLRRPTLEIIDVALNDRTAPAQGDGDGQPANGETIEAIVRIRNRGEGDAAGATVTMSSPAAEILASPAVLPIIPVNQIREARVLFRVPRTLAATELELTFRAVETRGPQVAQTELTETWPLRAKRPKVELAYRLYDGNSAASTGNRDGQISNGERVEVAIVATNRGELAALGVEVAIRSPHSEIRVEPATLVLGDLPAEAEAPEQRFVVDVPRGFGRDQEIDQLRLNLTVSQQEFRPQSEPVALPFQALRPNLRLDVESSPPVVQGKTGELVLAIRNTGTLDAEDVRVEVTTDVPGLDLLSDRDVPERRLEFPIGELEPRGQAARIRLGLNVRRSVAAGEAPVEVTVVQKDFSAIRQTIGLTVVGEEPAVISTAPVEPPQPPAARIPADVRPPTISFLRYTTGAKVSSEAIVLRFEVHHETNLVDLRLTHNGKQLTVGEPAEVTEQTAGTRTIRLAQYELPVQLDDGENRFEVIAVTGEGARGLRVLSIIRDRHAGEVWLAVVGVSDYLDPEVRDLAFADADARAVHDYYRSRFKLPPDHLFLLVNEEATLRNIKSVLGTQLARHASHPDDTVIIYFAGHGQREADPSGLSADGFAKYLLPFDGDPKDPFSTALGMEEVAGIIRRLRAERVVFIVDSCFSGAAGGRTLFDPNRPTPRSEITAEFLERIASAGVGRVVLSASGANEVAEERAELGHGVFTHFLLRGLEGAADDNRDGLIDVDEIYRFVYRRVSEATSGRQNPERRAPRLVGEVLVGRASVLPQR